jgi:dihydropyrimidinase
VIEPESKSCPCCGGALHVIGEDVSKRLDRVPAKLRVMVPLMHDLTGYTPYEGRRVTGWPVTVLGWGCVVVDDGMLRAAPGSGCFLPRAAALPSGRRAPELDPQQNFGAKL